MLFGKKRDLMGRGGSRLFSKAFQGEDSVLEWKGIDQVEQGGRAVLFGAIYRAYRNPRAHKELDKGMSESLREFLLINQLFILEAQSVVREAPRQ